MSGIWIAPDKYVDFAGPDRQLSEELYTTARATGFDPEGWLGYLPDPDPVLRKLSGGIGVLRELTSDPKVLSSMQLRKIGTLKKKDYSLAAGTVGDAEPTADARRLAEDLGADLDRIDLYQLWSQVLDAPYYGYAVVEIVWERADRRMRIARLVPRPQEWFGWGADDSLRFRSVTDALAEPVHPHKAVAARHFPTADNPYGLRLLSRCLWPVAVKKGGIRFWTNLCERFGSPWVIGKARSGAQRPEREEMVSALARMVQDAVAVITAGSEVDVHPVTGTAGDLHGSLVRYMDNAIAMVLMGQTLTSDIGTKGSRAASETHYAVLQDLQESDETIIATFMENLAWVYGQVNAPGVPSPDFAFREPEDYSARADLDRKLVETGLTFRREHYVRRYNLAEDEFDVPAAPSSPEQDAPAPGSDHALPAGRYTPEQQAIEDLVAGIVPAGVQALGGFQTAVDDAIRQAKSFEDLQVLLAALLDASGDPSQELLIRSMIATDLHGRESARED